MKVQEIMSSQPACCSTASTVNEAARLMTQHDCGEIPVLDGGKLAGVVTDRDIACRAVAQGKGPDTPVREVMSSPAITVTRDTSVEDCCGVMENHQIRRVPVVDEDGGCCGMVSQADLAQRGSDGMIAAVVRDVSRPSA